MKNEEIMIKKIVLIVVLGLLIAVTSCKNTDQKSGDGKMYVVATTLWFMIW